MGDTKYYDRKNKVVTEYKYRTVGRVNNIEVIELKDGQNKIPIYSSNAKMYFIKDSYSNKIVQVAFYNEENRHYKRMDWEHNHREFKQGEPHIQFLDNKEYRAPNKEEQKIFDMLKERNFEYDEN